MKKTFKFILCLALVCASLFLTSCGTYREVRSSREERRIVATVGDYEVKYELVRALFHTVKAEVDGGDDTVWTSDKAGEYFEKAMALVDDYLLTIYSTFAYAESIGIDPYGDEIDDLVDYYVTTDIEGGYINGNSVQGYGSKEAYLEALAKYYYTDSANRFMYRYTATTSRIHEYYTQTYANGTIQVSDSILRDFLVGPDVIHVHWVYRDKTESFTEKEMEETVRAALLAEQGSRDVLDTVRSLTLYLPDSNMMNGFYLTANTLSMQYQDFAAIAKGLSPYEVSEVVEAGGGYYVLVGMERDVNILGTDSGMDDITQLYLEYRMYNAIAEKEAELPIAYNSNFDQYIGKVLK